jgi:hypothetical protein
MVQWQYVTRETIVPLQDSMLRDMGEQGWELVTMVPVQGGSRFHYVFKRQAATEDAGSR